jgi:peptidoglycan hydrolase CwlO-like protein
MDQHVEQQDKLDNTDEVAIDKFNARLEVLNARGRELNAEVEQLNRDQALYNRDVAALNKRCAGMVVTIRDRNAVLKERAVRSSDQGAR